MRAAFGGWTRRMTLLKVTQAVENGLVTQVNVPILFRGTIQPLSPNKIALKPEGQRAWEWLQIHCMSVDPGILNPNDRILIADKLYKVMAQNDYSLNGYIEYQVIRDYQ